MMRFLLGFGAMGVVMLGGCGARSMTVTSSTSPPLVKKVAVKPGAHKWGAGKGTSVSVLTWHRIAEQPNQYTVTTPAKFAAQLAFLKAKNASVIRLEDAVKMVKAGEPLPPRAVALGFDDGFKSCYTQVFPLLKKYNWPATLYIYPNWISSGSGALTWEELKEMQASGLVDIQSHSMTHPNLPSMKPKNGMNFEQRLHHEVFDSKRILEEKMGRPITQFAYPYGGYNEQVLAAVKAAGYTSAWTVNPAPFRAKFAPGETWLTLPRFLIYRTNLMETFARQALGGPLALKSVSPRPNTTTSSRRPLVSATLDQEVDPHSVKMNIGIIQKVGATYNPQTRLASIRGSRDFHRGVWTVSVSATDKQGLPRQAAWAFMVR